MNVDNALTGMSYYYNALVAVKLYGGRIKIGMLVKAAKGNSPIIPLRRGSSIHLPVR